MATPMKKPANAVRVDMKLRKRALYHDMPVCRRMA